MSILSKIKELFREPEMYKHSAGKYRGKHDADDESFDKFIQIALAKRRYNASIKNSGAENVKEASHDVNDPSTFFKYWWVSVDDRYPDDGQVVLVSITDDNGRAAVWVAKYTESVDWVWITPLGQMPVSVSVKAWMPLPNPFMEDE